MSEHKQGEYIVELLVVVRADSATDAEALGERAAQRASGAVTHSTGTARILNVILSDTRRSDD